ncbi:cation diffusion facilitator family transporter [Cupriavidus sp. WKF15]|uniref:cation diffusion facilitator family transporter n=1 Tax=Cupriavidus sp. WKF15 TaxID=3032282 RepID=UPI0023E213DD|nr:cation diffusion facilitator family transporter [Cupriavidus sp. WKF15]WER49937.1 cation diffusion facilitator family transporter [Cupriavidus sp. WKF15]
MRIALALNLAMFVIGTTAGLWAQSSGLLADALDMLSDAAAYAMALIAVARGPAFKHRSARLSGILLFVLGLGIFVDVARRALGGTEPVGGVMMVFALLSLAVNATVLRMLARFRTGEVHLRATYLFTRADVVANLGVFVSGAIVAITGLRWADLVTGFLIGAYVVREATEILRDSRKRGSPA